MICSCCGKWLGWTEYRDVNETTAADGVIRLCGPCFIEQMYETPEAFGLMRTDDPEHLTAREA